VEGEEGANVTDLDVFVALLDGLNEDERAVVLDVALRSARKMHHGRRKYGEWRMDTDDRDWMEEAAQEADDLANYAAMARRQRARRV
jgi:hypothetical protein